MRMNSRGFSLVEMLVVVMIASIVGAIGFNSYQAYVTRARTAEARISLGAIYMAEKSFFVTNYSFTLCLANLGYQPYSDNSYYYTGFMNSAATTCGPSGNYNCTSYDFNGPPPLGGGIPPATCSCGVFVTDANGVQHSGCAYLPRVDIDPVTPLGAFVWPALQTTFTAGAQGKVKVGKLDVWTIDDQKTWSRVQLGE
jgi:prepilin-type N-terminal cleavage/methylation domain-containing protein